MEILNKKAKFNYELLEYLTAGIILQGTEIKSVRSGKVSFTDSYCYFKDGEIWMKNVHISEYEQGTIYNHDPKRDRKLLLNRNEIDRLEKKSEEKGLTVVPVKIFINSKNLAKVEIALAKGKNFADKRETIKKRDAEREIRENG